MKTCQQCGNNLLTRSQKKFCSTKCQHRYQNEKIITSWLRTNGKALTQKFLPQPVIDYLLREADYTCTRVDCGWNGVNPYTGRPTVEVNHINGNWHDNRRENLEVLCPNCHALTDNYGILNMTAVS